MQRAIYLDHNATTPPLPEVVEAMRACDAEPYLNPASQHEFGRRARRVLEDARERIGELLGANMSGRDPDRVIFTSGGTEANNLAVRGLLERAGASAPPGSQIVVSAFEHPSITVLADHLARNGLRVDRLGGTPSGVLRVDELPQLLQPETRLVCAMLAQNETGVLQPVADLAAICAQRNVPLHTDAAQAAGKIPLDFRGLGVTTMSIAAHKFGGPLGIGALVVRHGVELGPQLFGGFQQGGARPGTESVALVVGMLRALEIWQRNRAAWSSRLAAMRDEFERALCDGWPGAVVLGRDATRLPHVSQIALVGLERQALFIALDQAGIACSTGSACASGSSEPSPAVIAMNPGEAVISSALRFSFGVSTQPEEAAEAARRILKVCNNLRR